MNESYRQHLQERATQGIPPLPMNAAQVREVIEELTNPVSKCHPELKALLAERVPPGVDPAANVKADFLADVAAEKILCACLKPTEAVQLLGTMLGGYNVPHLVGFLEDLQLASVAAEQLKRTIMVFGNFDAVRHLAERGNRHAKDVLQSWAEAEWFTERPELPESIRVRVFRVDGEINTDDFSPARQAPSRPDIPLHALCMGESRFPGGIDEIARWRAEGHQVAFLGHTVGTGSSRKSATNSLIWHIGTDIPFVPNKRRGGVLMAERIAPIFFNTFEDSGGLPLRLNSIDKLTHGLDVTVWPRRGEVTDDSGAVVASFELTPVTLADEYRAGGRVPLIIGRSLTDQARAALGLGAVQIFASAPAVQHKPDQGYSLAQKLVGRACGRKGVLPGETCNPATATVGSQDSTGPMTRDELVELACLEFQADMVMQSFCHTAAYPTDKDKITHRTLPEFISERGGVALRPGDGIIHSWLNRLLVPDEVGTGGDSHTRFPLGISFPAGSGLVAFAAALGSMPLDMPESVLVKLKGDLPEGITLRDAVNALPLEAIRQGLSDAFGKGSRNVFNGRIIEIEGKPEMAVEQAFELTNATAERSAAAATVELSEESVAEFLRSNVALMRSMIRDGYQATEALQRRIERVEAWLAKPSLLRRDANAEFAATIELDLATITEPVLACPNNPDIVALLSEHAGRPVDEVFIGSCMTNISHFRAAAKLFEGDGSLGVKRFWVVPPTRMDRDQLAREGVVQLFEKIGARVEIPGCSLCMGNQARVEDNAVVFSTSTRNFDNRMGKGAQVYLGSAELAAVVAKLGRIPTKDEYFALYRERIAPHMAEVYRYLQLDRE